MEPLFSYSLHSKCFGNVEDKTILELCTNGRYTYVEAGVRRFGLLILSLCRSKLAEFAEGRVFGVASLPSNELAEGRVFRVASLLTVSLLSIEFAECRVCRALSLPSFAECRVYRVPRLPSAEFT